jgi:bacillithiol system protein YtxJ
MQFIPLDKADQLEEIKSAGDYQIILKHNTTCPISKGVLQRLQQEADTIPQVSNIHVLDLHTYRDLSDAIAEDYGVPHQSPQLLLVKNGKCIYNEWGFDISAAATAEAVGQ